MAENEIKIGKRAASLTVMLKGELTGYTAVFEPSTTFSAEGAYSANILIAKAEGEKLLASAKEVQKMHFKNFRGKNDKLTEITSIKPFSTVDDDGNEIFDAEGRYIVKTKNSARIENGIAGFKVAVFDAGLHPVKQKLSLGEGSIVKIKVDITGYCAGGKAGVSLKLKALQIIKFVPYAGADAAEGFEAEDGFEIEEAAAEEKGAETAEELEEADY